MMGTVTLSGTNPNGAPKAKARSRTCSCNVDMGSPLFSFGQSVFFCHPHIVPRRSLFCDQLKVERAPRHNPPKEVENRFLGGEITRSFAASFNVDALKHE